MSGYGCADEIAVSKGISYLLRHHPEAAALDMDSRGWVSVAQLIANMPMIGHELDRELLEYIVETDSKQRYAFDETGEYIRANQGHSVPVDIGFETVTPPETLWHGTATRFIDSIESEGLRPMTRLYVHLSSDIETAEDVGARHGRPAVYEVESGQMARDGFSFFLSENGVWLVEHVPACYLVRVL